MRSEAGKVQNDFILNLLRINRHIRNALFLSELNRDREMNGRLPQQASSNADDEERALLSRVAAGETDAFTELYRRYHSRLFKFVYRFSHSYADADELVNDIMMAVWRCSPRFRGDSKPSTWIFGIAYRQALKRLSRRNLRISHANVDELPHDRNRNLECEDWIRSGLDALPATQRIAVELVFFLGLSYDEVAEVTDCPVNTVKTRMFHARRKLKEHLLASATGKVLHGGRHD